jgi:hypothetical protein
MEFNTFIRKPFAVQAVEITEENIGEVAELIGTLRQKEDGTPFIKVNPRLVPNIYRVYPGFWMTKMGDNIRCYSKRIFHAQFTPNTKEIEGWVSFLNDSEPETEARNIFVELADDGNG